MIYQILNNFKTWLNRDYPKVEEMMYTPENPHGTAKSPATENKIIIFQTSPCWLQNVQFSRAFTETKRY